MIKNIISTVKSYNYRALNIRLIFYVIAISVLGIISVGSAEGDFYFKKQLYGFVAGVFLLFI